MLGVFAKFERGIIKERVNAGLARARANGTKLGRGNRKDGKASADEKRWGMSTAAMEKKIKALHKSGMGMLRIGRELGVGTALSSGLFPLQPQLDEAPDRLRAGGVVSFRPSINPCDALCARAAA